MSEMFCYQCEQTAGGSGCTVRGVCGKDATTAKLQDLLIWVTKGISQYAHRARKLGVLDAAIDRFVLEALFTTVTNVNFDPDRLVDLLSEAAKKRDRAKALYVKVAKEPEELTGPAAWVPATELDALIVQGSQLTLETRLDTLGRDVAGLQELILYGLKGMASYADHALILGVEEDEVYAFFHEMLDYLADDPTVVAELTSKALEVGRMNLKVMDMLDKANTGAYGQPEPTTVRVTPVKGKCILVSGHDLKDLADLLTQTEGKGINVYTHGEMLPCLAYPGLKKHPHLVGNYGGAWQDQQKEFPEFPGAILMTTNCIQRPADSYKNRIFTSGLVAWPGVRHIPDGDFQPVIDAALKAPGFREDTETKTITIGFAHDAVMKVADRVVEAVKSGAIRHFFLVGGCDGAKPGRNYYTELAESIPDDCVILTLACGKYRFNKLEFGEIGGVPRLLDCGQCNDAYSAIQIALALAKAFDCEVNDLPLSIVLSWYEQKAVCILLTLLHLGLKKMRIGPSLPAFVGPQVLDALVKNFGLIPIGAPAADLEEMLCPS